MVREDKGDIGAKFSWKFSGAEEKDQGNTLLFEIINAKLQAGKNVGFPKRCGGSVREPGHKDIFTGTRNKLCDLFL